MTLSDIILKHGRAKGLKLIGERFKAEDIKIGEEYRAKIARLYPNQGFPTLPFKVKKTLLMIDKKEEETDEWIWRRRHTDYKLA